MIKYLVFGFLVFGILACAKKEEVSKTTETGTSEMQGHEGHHHGTEAAKEKGLVMRTARADEIGKDVVCPVMSTKFKVKTNTQVADYKGKSYYFCCGGCPDEFSKDPDKYAK